MGDNRKDVGTPDKGSAKFYRKEIVDIVDKIEDEQLLRRVYALAEYLYIHK